MPTAAFTGFIQRKLTWLLQDRRSMAVHRLDQFVALQSPVSRFVELN